MNRFTPVILALGFVASAVFSVIAKAGDIKLTAAGIVIDADDAGIHTMSYPKLLTPGDQGLKPENITINPDGSGAAMSYTPSGKLTIDRQSDGSWLYHFTEIPPDRVKFSFGINFPLGVIDDGSLWGFDDEKVRPFPPVKDKVRLHMANPSRFVFQKKGAGFVITYPQKTFTVLLDQRVWGMANFNLGHGFYFPGKKTVPEISYSIKIAVLPLATSPSAPPAVTSSAP